MSRRRIHPLVRLIASLAFGLSVLAFFALVSSEMATHFFQGVAERTVRQAFREGPAAEGGERYDAVCLGSEGDPAPPSACDPLAVKAERSLRSASCDDRSFLHLLGKPWSCRARFHDGSTLAVGVSLGFRRHRLELALPFREPD